MVDTVVISTLYFISVVQLILQAGVVFYAYRVTKMTGSFRAWTLIIAAFTILTIRNVISLVLSLSLPADQLAALINSIGMVTLIVSSVVNIAAGVALFLGMFGLARRFENQAKAPQ
jgi:hypothetical protein